MESWSESGEREGSSDERLIAGVARGERGPQPQGPQPQGPLVLLLLFFGETSSVGPKSNRTVGRTPYVRPYEASGGRVIDSFIYFVRNGLNFYFVTRYNRQRRLLVD